MEKRMRGGNSGKMDEGRELGEKDRGRGLWEKG